MSETIKQFVGAIALVRRETVEGSEWLSLWNDGRNCLHFVEAHKLDDESFRESLLREIAWTTGLRTGKDFLVSSAPRAHLTFAEASTCQAEPTWFVVEFYLTELMGKRHRELLDSDDRIYWLTTAELQAGTAKCGRSICPRLLGLLRQADILAPWQLE